MIDVKELGKRWNFDFGQESTSVGKKDLKLKKIKVNTVGIKGSMIQEYEMKEFGSSAVVCSNNQNIMYPVKANCESRLVDIFSNATSGAISAIVHCPYSCKNLEDNVIGFGSYSSESGICNAAVQMDALSKFNGE